DLAGTAPCTTDDDCARTDGGATIAGSCCEGACIDFFDPTSCGGCGVVCATGLCGAVLSASLRETPDDGWSINGDAYWDASSANLFLTDRYDWQAGSIVWRDPIVVGDFEVDFSFFMSGDGADGMG